MLLLGLKSQTRKKENLLSTARNIQEDVRGAADKYLKGNSRSIWETGGH
jgi:hypothetical protein